MEGGIFLDDLPMVVDDEEIPSNVAAPNDAEAGDDNAEDLGELEDAHTTATKKRKTINRGPKLDSKRLLGPRGIPALHSHFDSVSFKGKGHEMEDMDLLMSKLEHWAHRLYPKLMFPDCLEQIETLGHKKEMQTCLKRLRMGMPIMDENQQSMVISADGPAANSDLEGDATDMENLFPQSHNEETVPHDPDNQNLDGQDLSESEQNTIPQTENDVAETVGVSDE